MRNELAAHWPAIRRLIATIAACAAVLWLCDVIVGCAELQMRQRAQWLSECEADGNKAYQCLERWQHMQNGGEE